VLALGYAQHCVRWVLAQLGPGAVTDEGADPRLALRALAVDLLALFDLPEWPAAELLLFALTSTLARLIPGARGSGGGLGGGPPSALDAATAGRVAPVLLSVLGTVLARLSLSRSFIAEHALRVPPAALAAAAPASAAAGSAAGAGPAAGRMPSRPGDGPSVADRQRSSGSGAEARAGSGADVGGAAVFTGESVAMAQPCLCGRRNLPGVTLVGCDECPRWYHGACVGIDADADPSALSGTHWACDDCRMRHLVLAQQVGYTAGGSAVLPRWSHLHGQRAD
jgi:hypothetical protein